MAPDERLITFTRYAEAAAAQVTLVADVVDVAALLAGGTDRPVRATAALWARYPALWTALGAAGCPVEDADAIAACTPDRAALAAALAGGTGLVPARAGVAETGSLLLADDTLAGRLLGMLADVCVALLPLGAILPGLDEAGALLRALDQAGHRYCSLVTGPSRTADIERVLTIGVQGPKALHIIVLTTEGA